VDANSLGEAIIGWVDLGALGGRRTSLLQVLLVGPAHRPIDHMILYLRLLFLLFSSRCCCSCGHCCSCCCCPWLRCTYFSRPSDICRKDRMGHVLDPSSEEAYISRQVRLTPSTPNHGIILILCIYAWTRSKTSIPYICMYI